MHIVYLRESSAFCCLSMLWACFAPGSAGCRVSCLILSFPPINKTENSKNNDPSAATQPQQMCSCLSVAAGRAVLIPPTPPPVWFSASVVLSKASGLARSSFIHTRRRNLLSLCSTHCGSYLPLPVCTINPFSVGQGIWKQAVSRLQIRARQTDISL